METKVIAETDTFYIEIGRLPESRRSLPFDLVEKYLVVNKQHGVIEYVTEVFYFAQTWANQMEEALATMGKEVPQFAPPMPNGQIN